MRSQVLTQKQIEKYRMDQKTATKIEQISLDPHFLFEILFW